MTCLISLNKFISTSEKIRQSVESVKMLAYCTNQTERATFYVSAKILGLQTNLIDGLMIDESPTIKANI